MISQVQAMSQILMICGNTSDFIDHPLPKHFVTAHGVSHHTWAPGTRPSKSGAASHAYIYIDDIPSAYHIRGVLRIQCCASSENATVLIKEKIVADNQIKTFSPGTMTYTMW